MGGIGGKELLIILAIAAVIFGAKRVRELGEGLGQSMKDFRKSLRDEDSK
jgi:sec-independent protein translocase protein TatA